MKKQKANNDKLITKDNKEYKELLANSIREKLTFFCENKGRTCDNVVQEIAIQIVDLKQPTVIPLDELETKIIRIMCGLYNNGIEPTVEQASKTIDMDARLFSLIFYKILHKIGKYADEETEKLRNKKTKLFKM